jgi:hypothetical protein
MNKINIILGGLKLPSHVLNKYTSIYNNTSIVVPFTFTCMLLGRKYIKYNELNDICNNYVNIHFHVLSGSCYYLYNFLKLYPDNVKKIKSQIYDSPCHISGIAPSLYKLYNIPPKISNISIYTIFNDCYNVSNEFIKTPIVSNIPTGIITSPNDIIVSNSSINTLLSNWNNENLHLLKTNSNHLESFKDNPQEYIDFCNYIKNKTK